MNPKSKGKQPEPKKPPKPPPLECRGHVEQADDSEELRAIKHIANALDPRGAQTSQLIALLTRLVAAVETIAASEAPEKATDLGGEPPSTIDKGAGFPLP